MLWLSTAVQSTCAVNGSQKQQDVWVEAHMTPTERYFVDLAANQPRCLSNSELLERKHAW